MEDIDTSRQTGRRGEEDWKVKAFYKFAYFSSEITFHNWT